MAAISTSSILSTASANPYGAILSAAPCTGANCKAVINACSGPNCHDITNSCVGRGCTLPVYINAQVPACLQDTASGNNIGCFVAGITELDFEPSSAGSSLVLTSESGSQYLASLFLSSASAPTASLSTVTTLPGYQICEGVPPAESICSTQRKLCTLQEPLKVTSSSATNCILPYQYPLDLNGYPLQGDTRTQIYFNNTIQNATGPQFFATGWWR